MKSTNHWKIVGILGSILVGGILFFVNPEYATLAPKCPFRWLTGWDCPACGIQRAIHQILHLNFRAAFGYNPFLVVSLPYLTLVTITHWFDPHQRLKRIKATCSHPVTVRIYLILLLSWWIVRNAM
ncbi:MULTISPECIES: DUF2752 domain-containing protein [Butyricimonas]|uniref:DUF2752 domain-containing protein n=1 Tax=Butyricimonas TaxID=574697 RepID=UPI0009F3B6BA